MRNAYDKWLAGEGCCNANNFIHIEIPDCKKEDVCDCENILLEISKLHTDDEILQEEIDELSGNVETLSGEVDNKLDITAYTPVDLSDYYTKEEVDELIPDVPSLSGYATEQWVQEQGYLTEHQPIKTINGEPLIGTGNIEIDCSGGTIDAYTKQESDAKYALKTEIPSLSGYATENWVNTNYQPKGNYLTEHQPLKTINGQVISGTGNIEIEASGASITVDSELNPISTNPVENKVITEALNDKLDASAYTPVDLSEYVVNSTLIQYITNLQQQIDSLTAAISGCCGESGETQYRWVTETGENDYWCSGTTKMSKEKQQSSTDGVNWTDTGSERSGSIVLETNSIDCGYVPVYGNKLIAHYNNGNSQTIYCTGAWNDSFIDGTDYKNYETGASGLTAVEVGDCPTKIAGYGLSGCTNLTSVTLTNNIESIGSFAFDSCTSLSSITIPSSVTYISQNAFIRCSKLSSVIINATTPPSIGSGIFANTDVNLIIYVPANSVDTYKSNHQWSTYANRIQSIS